MSHFYDNGLKFSCTRCSNCCRHDPGYVFLSKQDLCGIADFLEISIEKVKELYCTTVGMGSSLTMISLREKPNNDCTFWGDTGCSIYPARPVQCRTYPFWSTVLADSYSWKEEHVHCPGIGQGRSWSKEEITVLLKLRKDNTPIME